MTEQLSREDADLLKKTLKWAAEAAQTGNDEASEKFMRHAHRIMERHHNKHHA
jgi:predicted solute-binding protein